MRTRKRARVLWLMRGLGLGGAERLLSSALPHLDLSRFEYAVAYAEPDRDQLVPSLARAGVSTVCLGQRSRLDVRGLLRLTSLMRSMRPDVVHMHGPYMGVIGSIAAAIAGVPCTVYTEHTSVQRQGWLVSLLHRRFIRCKDSIICVSNSVRETVTSLLGSQTGKPSIQTIYNGVDWESLSEDRDLDFDLKSEFKIPARHQVVTTVANLRPIKRHVDLILAASRVVNRRPNVTFLLVGEGEERPALEDLVRRLGLERHVVFAGTRHDAPSIIAKSDLFALASDYEGLGVAALEALSCKVPVIATRVGGISEVVRDGVDGLLVEPRDPAAMSRAILGILEDPERSRQFTESSKGPIMRRFDIRLMVSKIEGVYSELLTRKTGFQFV